MTSPRATALLTRQAPDTGRHPAPEPLFLPVELGLDADSWDEVRADVPRCEKCRRPLREERSLQAGIGPCCAAKIGWAVYINMRKAREARKARIPGQRAPRVTSRARTRSAAKIARR